MSAKDSCSHRSARSREENTISSRGRKIGRQMSKQRISCRESRLQPTSEKNQAGASQAWTGAKIGLHWVQTLGL
jgi:hypothetical protein